MQLVHYNFALFLHLGRQRYISVYQNTPALLDPYLEATCIAGILSRK
jgi:hypothetical protein